MRFHVVNMPHTQTTKEYIACAYTQKAIKFCDMMTSRGHEVFLYAGEETDTLPGTELVTTFTREQQLDWFGDFDFHQDFFPITWGMYDRHWVEMNDKVIEEMHKRIKPGDIICLIMGFCQKQIADVFTRNPVVEYGIGYRGSFSDFRVFESYAHMHWIYGSVMNSDNGRHYDAVIPNYFDVNDFYTSDVKEDYHAFLGRFTPRKGITIAVEATKQLGVQLIMAGQGCYQDGNTFSDNRGWSVSGDHLVHIGHVGVEERAALLSKAQVCYMPTTYLEPFGGVSVESLLSGTPVIASDFGAFPEIVHHGLNGYRFRTIGEAAYYANEASNGSLLLDSEGIRAEAINRFSMENVAKSYEDYFMQVIGAYNGTADIYSPWHGQIDRYSYPFS